MTKMNLPRGSLLMALLISLVSSAIIAPQYTPVSAHGGGTPRLTNVPIGPYHLYAWSEPDPWRVGEVHLSLAVTMPNPDSSSSQVEIPVTDVEITVTFTPVGNPVSSDTGQTSAASPPAPIVVMAQRQAFLGDFYFEADPILPVEGDWQIGIVVTGKEGSGSTEFMMEALPARTINWTLVAGAGAVLVLLVVLLASWSRAQQPAQPARRPHRNAGRLQSPSSEMQAHEEA
ncbi:MAG: hypothetical protein IT328_09175 [Caldilineaceae bacterium]|nr:hypothetical protein [Caldilineaceae bacterium]